MLRLCLLTLALSCAACLIEGSIANASETDGLLFAQDSSLFPPPDGPVHFTAPQSPNPMESELLPGEFRREDLISPSGIPRVFPLGLQAEWITGSEVDLANYDVSLQLPLLIGEKSPPPIIKLGFLFTDFSAPEELGIPDELFQYSVGVSWFRKFNDRWAIRTWVGAALATDNLNTSSDAWQFRGGIFAIYETSPHWTWTFGAIALGRNDLPVLPAVGAIWVANETTRVDLLLPNPRANFLLSDNGSRQNWAYLGGGFNGYTWAFETTDMTDDTITYGDLRIVAGWESRPSAPVGTPFALGRKFYAEFGYAFSRDLEFDDEADDISLGDAFLFRLSTNW